MAEKRIDINELREKLTDLLNKVGVPGCADVTYDDKTDEYIVKIGENEFKAFYPEKENTFTLQLINSYKELPTGINVDYIEAFCFTVKDDAFVPSEFVIYQYPQLQTILLVDNKSLEKGTIIYENSCSCGGSIRIFEEPVFESDVIKIELLKDL